MLITDITGFNLRSSVPMASVEFLDGVRSFAATVDTNLSHASHGKFVCLTVYYLMLQM